MEEIIDIDELAEKEENEKLKEYLKEDETVSKELSDKIEELTNEKAKLSDSAKQLTPQIKELRKNIKSLEYIKDHSQRCIDYNKKLERKKELER